MSLFGSSGIRGVVGELITPELAAAIGSAVGSLHDSVFIGRDARESGDLVLSGLKAGLLSVGADVYDGGVLPTPTVARASSGRSCGIMVTASHNPAPYNGVKLWNPDGSPFNAAQSAEIERIIAARDWSPKSYEYLGREFQEHGAIEDHMEAVLSSLQAEGDVVVDCASGPASLITPLLLRRMGCAVRSINSQLDGHFPGRPPEPLEGNLADLLALVRSRPGSIGLAHDGDGDRVAAVDERGRYLDGDRLLALFTSFLQPDEIVVPINASMAIDDLISGKVHRTRVGDVHVCEAMKASGASFGGEPSGTYIFGDQTLCPDGIYGAALLARMAEESSLADLVDELPSYHISQNVRSYAKGREEISQCLDEEFQSLDCERLSQVDGWRAEYGDGWFLLRFSGTEPKIRITAEARDQARMEELLSIADSLLGRCL